MIEEETKNKGEKDMEANGITTQTGTFSPESKEAQKLYFRLEKDIFDRRTTEYVGYQYLNPTEGEPSIQVPGCPNTRK